MIYCNLVDGLTYGVERLAVPHDIGEPLCFGYDRPMVVGLRWTAALALAIRWCPPSLDRAWWWLGVVSAQIVMDEDCRKWRDC